jgi:hypothetical protein
MYSKLEAPLAWFESVVGDRVMQIEVVGVAQMDERIILNRGPGEGYPTEQAEGKEGENEPIEPSHDSDSHDSY